MSRFERREHGNSHSYRLNGQKVPGVTTVVGALDKPALVGWAARCSADWVVDHREEIEGMSASALHKAVADARFHQNKKATTRGHRVHALAERLQHGEEVDVPDELLVPVEAIAHWLDAVDASTVVTEAPVCHTSYLYAGTLDAIVDTPRWGRLLVDFKTSSRAYPEHAMQLSAYRFADLLLSEEPQVGPRGGRKPSIWHEQPMIPVDGCAVVHVPEGADTVELLPVRADEAVWTSFLHLLTVYRDWVQATSWKGRDQPGAMTVIGAPIFPEDNFPDMTTTTTSEEQD